MLLQEVLKKIERLNVYHGRSFDYVVNENINIVKIFNHQFRDFFTAVDIRYLVGAFFNGFVVYDDNLYFVVSYE